MNDEVEVAVTITVKNGARHAFVQWLPGDEAAMELAIDVACDKAADGYRFQGIHLCENGERQLLLIQPLQGRGGRAPR